MKTLSLPYNNDLASKKFCLQRVPCPVGNMNQWINCWCQE